MTGIAAALDAAAVLVLGGCVVALRRSRDEPDGDAGRSAGLALIGVGLALLSVPLWSLP